jgi:hypothetical protein
MRTLFTLIILGVLASCYPPTQSNYSPTIAEQPQPLHPSFEYAGSAVSVPSSPLTLTPCTVCNRTSTIIPNSWGPSPQYPW